MAKFEIEDIGVAIIGAEEDYFECVTGGMLGIASLLRNAGAESCSWQLYTGFKCPGDTYFKQYADRYQKETGRKYPHVYKVKITVEAEPVSEEECEKFWESKRYEDDDVQE